MFLIKINASEVADIVNHHHRQIKVKKRSKSVVDQNVHTPTKRNPIVTEENKARHKRQKLKVI
jgi:hypothetical protein